MTSRKETPDVLGEVLGGAMVVPPSAPEPTPKAAPKRSSPRRKPTRRQQTKPPKWEYVEIVFRDYGGFRPRTINGEEVKHWKRAPLIHNYLNYLGQQGWELAGIGCQRRGEMPAYLKRPKA